MKFKIGDEVRLRHSSETGDVIGRAEYAHAESTYLVRYRNGEGCQVETWWGESAIEWASVEIPPRVVATLPQAA